jgi:hypothetical protein
MPLAPVDDKVALGFDLPNDSPLGKISCCGSSDGPKTVFDRKSLRCRSGKIPDNGHQPPPIAPPCRRCSSNQSPRCSAFPLGVGRYMAVHLSISDWVRSVAARPGGKHLVCYGHPIALFDSPSDAGERLREILRQ